MYKTTVFKSLKSTKPAEVCELSKILAGIQSGEWAEKVEKCKTDLAQKNKLLCFTPTGIFNHRSIKGLEEYNGIVCLDVDHVEKPEELKNKCKSIPWVYAAFITPSGKGLKVIVKTSATTENYVQVEKQVADEFLKIAGSERDNRAKDIARIQFVSYDPAMWINDNSIIFA